MHVHFSIVLALVVSAIAPAPEAVLATILDPKPMVTRSVSDTEVHGLHQGSAIVRDSEVEKPFVRKEEATTPRDVVIKKRNAHITDEPDDWDTYKRRKRQLKISFACALAAVSIFFLWLLTAAVKQAIRQPNTKKAIQTYQEAIATMKQERVNAAAEDESS